MCGSAVVNRHFSLLFIKTTVDISLDSQNLHHHDRNRGRRDVYRWTIINKMSSVAASGIRIVLEKRRPPMTSY